MSNVREQQRILALDLRLQLAMSAMPRSARVADVGRGISRKPILMGDIKYRMASYDTSRSATSVPSLSEFATATSRDRETPF